MNFEVYREVEVAEDFSAFDFVSVGKKGAISKRVAFTRTEWDNIYNLVLGDIDDDKINYFSVSDNEDRDKILATVVSIVDYYTERFPERWISFVGSTIERTRLYRIAIGSHLEELSAIFTIYAYVDGKIMIFVKNMKINGFLIKRKKS